MSARQLLFITKELASLAKQEIGQSMLHILVGAMTDMLETLPSEPPYPTIAPPPGARQPASELGNAVPAAVPASSYSGDASTRKQRSSHRRVPTVKEQQAENRQLLQQQEALSAEPKHTAMRQTRQRLPAFSKRKDLMIQLSQHSVIVISGATGAATYTFCTPHVRCVTLSGCLLT